LVNDQRDAQFFYVFIYIFNFLHVSSTSCSSSGEINCVNKSLVAVTLCRWPCHVQVGSCEDNIRIDCLVCRSMLLHTRQSILILSPQLPTCTRHGHRHRVRATRDCIDTIYLSWWWARCARNT